MYTCTNCGGDGWKTSSSWDYVECSDCNGEGGWSVSCSPYVQVTCSVCGGDGIDTRETTSQGSVLVKVSGTNRINSSSGSWTGTVGANSAMDITFSAATAPSGYPTKVGRTVQPAYTIRDDGYGNCRVVVINAAGSYWSLDGYTSGGVSGTRYHDKTVSMGAVTNSTLTGYYFYPGYMLRDTYVAGTRTVSDEHVATGGASGSGSVSATNASGSDVSQGSATSISWSSSGLSVVGSGILQWNTSTPVRSFSMPDFH